MVIPRTRRATDNGRPRFLNNCWNFFSYMTVGLFSLYSLVVVNGTDTITTNKSATNTSRTSTTTTPREPNFFTQQWVDHMTDGTYSSRRWTQRYFTLGTHFRGPGYPIFLILGGEGGIEPSRGVLYPYVTNRLAKLFGAYVIEPEHRFYGASQPISQQEIDTERRRGRADPRLLLLTSEQALHDDLRLTRIVRDRLRCSRDKFSPRYCPIVTFGGSYPGFLSAMARLLFPSTVDIAYAASAPMKFYAQQVDQYAYYDHITNVTDTQFPGCANAVRQTLRDVVEYYSKSYRSSDSTVTRKIRAIEGIIESWRIGICNSTLPHYIQDVPSFLNEVNMMVGYTFANANMAYYPPSTDEPSKTHLGQACQIFLQSKSNSSSNSKKMDENRMNDMDVSTSLQILADFFVAMLGNDSNDDTKCFNMTKQIPAGHHGTITAGDWSGVGMGHDAESWDFQTCSLLIETIGFADTDKSSSTTSMFYPPRNWTMEWLEHHCHVRFGIRPDPYQLVNRWHFDEEGLIAEGASRILFTNGLNDGWSVSGIQHNLSDTLVAMNFPNGSHHSDLSYYNGDDDDATEDIKLGRDRAQTLLATWLAELPGGYYSSALSSASKLRYGNKKKPTTQGAQQQPILATD